MVVSDVRGMRAALASAARLNCGLARFVLRLERAYSGCDEMGLFSLFRRRPVADLPLPEMPTGAMVFLPLLLHLRDHDGVEIDGLYPDDLIGQAESYRIIERGPGDGWRVTELGETALAVGARQGVCRA